MPNFENPPLSEPNIESKRKKKPKRAGIIPTAVLAVAALIGGEKAIAETEKTPINPAEKSKTVENAKQKSERQELFSPDARVDLATRIIADIDDINDLEQFIEDGIYSIEHPKGLTQGTMVVWGDESKHFDRARVGQPLEMALRFLTKNPNPEQWTNEEKAQAAIWLQAADNALQRVRDFNKQAQEMSPDELAKYNPDPIGLKKTMNSLQRSHEERRDEMSAKFRGQGFALKTTTERAEARALNGIPLETIIKLRQDIIEQNPDSLARKQLLINTKKRLLTY